MIERNARAPCQRFKFYGSKAIDVRIDCLKLGTIFGAEKLSAGYAGDLAQRGKVDPVVAGRVGVAKADRVDDPLPRAIRYLFGIIAAAFTVLYLFNAWAPEISPDGSSYHLSLVALYLRVHGFKPVLTSVYSMLSGGVDILFMPAFAIGRHSAAALTHFAFLIALALAVLSYGRRIGQPLSGAAAALLVYLSPVVGIDGTSAYNDVAVAAIVFSLFYWVQIWDSQREGRILIAIGLLAGYSYAAKYTAFVMLFYAVGFVAWRTRRPHRRWRRCARW